MKTLLLACLLACSLQAAQAPEFPADLKWLNTEKPLPLSSLRGKIVLLDFWTFCCINCMHVLPELHALEEKYKDELVVVGVHSAKFTAEQAGDKIKKAILRFKITHPVLNDFQSRVWDLYGVQAWPTLVLIAPDGELLVSLSGDHNVPAIDKAIAMAAEKYGSQIKRGKMAMRLESEAKSPLSFPGKVLADEKSGRLFVSDSGHGRVVIASLRDGHLIKALNGFKNPQGLALNGDMLFVADLGANSVVQSDLKSGVQSTLASKLNSPWDLAWQDGALYIAMAGAHQIWKLGSGPWAGDGRENLLDGVLKNARFAQPSGLCGDGKDLFSADSESSSVRKLSGGEVSTLNGKGLFEYGDSEGGPDKARLQHPLGVHFSGGMLYVADSFNGRIKTIDPATKAVKFFGPAVFDEPGGLWVAGGKLYVADTNHHAVKVIDLMTQKVSSFAIKGL